MKRERAHSFSYLPCLNSGCCLDICTPHQNYVVHKRLRDRSGSPFSKACVVRDINGQTKTSSCVALSPVTRTSTIEAPPPTLMQFADVFIDPSAVSPLEVVTLAEDMAADFYSEVSIMYDVLSEVKIPTAKGRAVDALMRRLHAVLSANANGHTTGENLSTQSKNVRGIYSGLIRVFVFLYQRYYRAFVVLEVSELLAASWHRLLAFVVEYRNLDKVFVRKMYDYVARIICST